MHVDFTATSQGLHSHCRVTVNPWSLYVHCTVTAWSLHSHCTVHSHCTGTTQSLHIHGTASQSLHSHCTVTAQCTMHNAHFCKVMAPSLQSHGTVTAQPRHSHNTVPAQSLHAHFTVTSATVPVECLQAAVANQAVCTTFVHKSLTLTDLELGRRYCQQKKP